MRVLSLFSGGGLGDYGLELAGMEIVGQVEIDDYCQKILSLRWPDVPKWGDVKFFDGKAVARVLGPIDLISGGFPCQDISQAGRGAGITGERSGLWKEMFRIICEIRPRFVLVENVSALLGRGLGTVLGDLAEIGYDAEWDCIPASAVGAPHQRDRVWIVAYTSCGRSGTLRDAGEKEGSQSGHELSRKRGGLSREKSMANSIGDSARSSQRPKGDQGRTDRQPQYGHIFRHDLRDRSKTLGWIWESEPAVGRVAHGIANRVDRLKLLGNGQVVQVVQYIGEQIMKADLK